MTNKKKGEIMKTIVFSVFIAIFINACAYTQGTEVTQKQIDTIKVGKSKESDVEKIIGYPARKSSVGNKEIWYYDFTKISHNPFGGNVSESTIIEFKNGVVVKKYKSKGSNSNPLLDAAK